MKVEDRVLALTEEEYLASGGSQVTVDLSKRMHDRVLEVTRQVHSLSTDLQTTVVLHTTALGAVMLQYYVFLCKKERRSIPTDEFLELLKVGLGPHVDAIRAVMQKNGDWKP